MENIVFYFLEALILLSALGVVLVTSPIYSALFLVLTMIGVAGIFVSLDAFFLAGVQLVVYAGAVTVMFVMVVMLFNLDKEKKAFSKGTGSNFLKAASVGLIWSILSTSLLYVFSDLGKEDLPRLAEGSLAIKELASHLFLKYVFGFEVICILLLLVIVGAVSLARAKGGTHA